MAFKYKNWMLFKREIILENGSKRTVHFFSKYRPFKGEPCDLPKETIVKINKRTGLPFLQKDKLSHQNKFVT